MMNAIIDNLNISKKNKDKLHELYKKMLATSLREPCLSLRSEIMGMINALHFQAFLSDSEMKQINHCLESNYEKHVSGLLLKKPRF